MKVLIQHAEHAPQGGDHRSLVIENTRFDPKTPKGLRFREGLEQALLTNADIWIVVEPGQRLDAETLITLVNALQDRQAQVVTVSPSSRIPKIAGWVLHFLFGRGVSFAPAIRGFSRGAMERLQLTGHGSPDIELLFRQREERILTGILPLNQAISVNPRPFPWFTLCREFVAQHALKITLGSAALPLALLVFVRPLPVVATALLGCLSLVLGTLASATQFWIHWKLAMEPPWQKTESLGVEA